MKTIKFTDIKSDLNFRIANAKESAKLILSHVSDGHYVIHADKWENDNNPTFVVPVANTVEGASIIEQKILSSVCGYHVYSL